MLGCSRHADGGIQRGNCFSCSFFSSSSAAAGCHPSSFHHRRQAARMLFVAGRFHRRVIIIIISVRRVPPPSSLLVEAAPPSPPSSSLWGVRRIDGEGAPPRGHHSSSYDGSPPTMMAAERGGSSPRGERRPEMLSCIVASLSSRLVVNNKRLGLATVVSERWLRLLLADLRFPREHVFVRLPGHTEGGRRGSRHRPSSSHSVSIAAERRQAGQRNLSRLPRPWKRRTLRDVVHALAGDAGARRCGRS